MAQRSPEPQEIERLDVTGLANLVRQHRGALSLRQAAADAGVSFSTLTRIESGSQPDLASFTKVCAWLGEPPSRFFAPVAARARNSMSDVVQHLRADPRLTPRSANLIAEMLSSMYEQLASREERPALAMHLRAASTMRPGVPERMSSMLSDMYTALQTKVEAGEL